MNENDPTTPFVAPHVSHDAIAALAHQIWIREGQPEGRAADHWRQAEHQLHTKEAEIATVDLTREIPMQTSSGDRLLS